MSFFIEDTVQLRADNVGVPKSLKNPHIASVSRPSKHADGVAKFIYSDGKLMKKKANVARLKIYKTRVSSQGRLAERWSHHSCIKAAAEAIP